MDDQVCGVKVMEVPAKPNEDPVLIGQNMHRSAPKIFLPSPTMLFPSEIDSVTPNPTALDDHNHGIHAPDTTQVQVDQRSDKVSCTAACNLNMDSIVEFTKTGPGSSNSGPAHEQVDSVSNDSHLQQSTSMTKDRPPPPAAVNNQNAKKWCNKLKLSRNLSKQEKQLVSLLPQGDKPVL